MHRQEKNAGNLNLLGGILCLDFINTRDRRGAAEPVEYLKTYPDLVAWCKHAGILSENDWQPLVIQANKRRDAESAALSKAVELRELLYRMFSEIIMKKAVARGDLARFNVVLSQTMKQSRILQSDAGFFWDSSGSKTKPDWMLHLIVRTAADFLTSGNLRQMKSCADPVCGRLFLDISRNRSRRWCDMQGCGNRAKAKRFYQKQGIFRI